MMATAVVSKAAVRAYVHRSTRASAKLENRVVPKGSRVSPQKLERFLAARGRGK